MSEKLRWKIWWWITKLPNVCPANAHSVLIWRQRRSILVDSVCRKDCAANAVCWCGKLRAEAS